MWRRSATATSPRKYRSIDTAPHTSNRCATDRVGRVPDELRHTVHTLHRRLSLTALIRRMGDRTADDVGRCCVQAILRAEVLVKKLGVVIVSLVGCVPTSDRSISGRLGIEIPEVEESSPLALLFDDAAAETGVSADVLKALAYVETRLQPAAGEIEFDGQDAPYGLFALRGARLERAAALSGFTTDQVQSDPRAGVFAAASLLRALADEGRDPEDWRDALQRWDAFDGDLVDAFADDVLRLVDRGAAIPLADGTTLVISRAGSSEGSTSSGLGATGVVWRPSPNYNSRNGNSVELVVIHTCEGSYAGCVSHLRNSNSGVSAHYVVKEDGSEVSQLVDENSRAWHIRANYRPSLNSGRLSHRANQSSNTFSVGIEHGGSANQRTFSEGQIDRSIQLVRDITDNHNIPRDRYHIVGHGQLQPETRIDPGPNWPWTSYLAAIASGSQQPPPPPEEEAPPPEETPPPEQNPPPQQTPTIVVVDNETPGRFRSSSNWGSSDWSQGRVGGDYMFRSPELTSDPAGWRIPVPSAGSWEVFARVPGNGYNTNTPYLIHHSGGTSVVFKNVNTSGASWVSLGTYDFAAVDDFIVQLSCWTGGDGFVVADAVKIEKR
jgi:N-acetyl-anhydromuramyl-L-alanine amidase AmpD